MHRIEGYVIASANGMLADAAGVMPDAIRNNADQNFFQSSLDRAAVVVHGRHSHEGGPRAAKRKRLVVTRRIATIAPDPMYPNAMSWNPKGASLEQAVAAICAGDGPIAIIGGPQVFTLFLPRYDAFHLSHASRAQIPGGRPVFTEAGPGELPEDVLARHGLKPGPRRDLDPAAGVFVVTWLR